MCELMILDLLLMQKFIFVVSKYSKLYFVLFSAF